MTSAPAYTRFIISHLDEALALTRAATTLLLGAAAEIRKLPGTDIRDGQLSGSVREALAELDAACHRWLPKRTTVERAINSAQVSLALTAAFEQDDNVPRHTRVWQWKLPVALNVIQAEALREHIIDNGGAWMSVREPVKPPAGLNAGHWGPALDLDGRPINVEFSSRFCTFMGVEFIVIKDKSARPSAPRSAAR